MSAIPVSAPPGWYPDSDPQQLRYWDGSSWTQEVAAATRGPAPARPLLRTRGLSKVLLAVIAAQVIAYVVAGAFAFLTESIPALNAYLERNSAALDAAEAVVIVAGLTYLAALPLSGVLAMVWTWDVRVNAEALSPYRHTRARFWAWAGWITPIVCFWFPYQVLQDVDRADRAVLDSSRTTSHPAPVAAWWSSFMAYFAISRLLSDVDVDLPRYLDWLGYWLCAGAAVIALILFRRVVQTIDGDQASIASGSTHDRPPA